MKRLWSILFLMFLFGSCAKEELVEERNILPDLPAHFPELIFPEDNLFEIDKWELGKELFYSSMLSIDGKVSCASCHSQEYAFSDNKKQSTGVNNREGIRNSPSLSNIGYHPYFTREGGVPTLEMQILVPIQEHDEFDFNIVEIAELLNQDSIIRASSIKAFGRAPDPFVITRAIATFERSLISCNSKYDKYLEGKLELTGDENAGRLLFFSDRLACGSCHSGFNFSDYSITNNGLYDNYTDQGKFRLSRDSSDLACFKTPSLRNVEVTAPYMHDGSIETLESVIDHYNGGVEDHRSLDTRINNFQLSEVEKRQILAFLKTLTDIEFLNNRILSDN